MKKKKKSAKQKKSTKKSVKRKVASKSAKKKVKPVKKKSKKGSKTTKAKSKVTLPKVDGQLIGRVTHYFPHVNAAVVIIEKAGLKLGDRILIKGHTTSFEETIQSMQVDHQSIQVAKKGDEIGLAVKERTREHDLVYKLK